MTDAIIIGSGPAGLMAAEMLADAGFSVMVAEAKPSVGRKFLMAGKSGLNLTKHESLADFLQAYSDNAAWVAPYLTGFNNLSVMNWARGLDQEIFTGSSGRVFPKAMKASPLLRNWLNRLSENGVTFQTRFRWVGWEGGALVFDSPEGKVLLSPKVTVLAMGGASWARLGSDGAWAEVLREKGVPIAPFQPSNMGIRVAWSDHMTGHFGAPVKNCGLTCGAKTRKGEFVISKDGLEGSAIYGFSPEFRTAAPLVLDLLPDLSEQQIVERLESVSTKLSVANLLRRTLKLGAAKAALLNEFAPRPISRADLPKLLKSLAVSYSGTAPLDVAISVAGGVEHSALNDDLMLTALPGVFCAGEMLDWEAPTGGYLISGCLATGRAAGIGAVTYLRQAHSSLASK